MTGVLIDSNVIFPNTVEHFLSDSPSSNSSDKIIVTIAKNYALQFVKIPPLEQIEIHSLMAAQVLQFNKSSLIPLSFISSCSCSSKSNTRRRPTILKLTTSKNLHQFNFKLELNPCNGGLGEIRISSSVVAKHHSPRLIIALASAEQPEHIEISKEEVNSGTQLSVEEDLDSEHRQKATQLKKRIIFGLGIGVIAGGVILAGGWVFTVGLAASVFIGAREYFELVRSHGISSGMTPPPRYVSRACSIICFLMPLLTLYYGNIDAPVTSAAFLVAMALLLQRGNPRFAQLSSTIFGLFYCGYLPCFWVKLRCGLAAPALNTRAGAYWPLLLGGQTQWTVGLVATLISISSIIAADTFAFIGGKAFGRTPLNSISPKKTWEGALVGLGGCIATSVILAKILSWPTSLLSAVPYGFLNFFGSLFGDLTESMIKRDAGVKDSGSLIPGHGGILDRVDSYIFTGALAYSFVKTLLPLYGL